MYAESFLIQRVGKGGSRVWIGQLAGLPADLPLLREMVADHLGVFCSG